MPLTERSRPPKGSLSNTVAGLIVVRAGYDIAFLSRAGVALIAFVVFLIAMPETAEPATTERRQPLLSDRALPG